MKGKKTLSYQESGVVYTALDPLKRMAQIEGKKTVGNLRHNGMKEVEGSRGESAYVVDYGNSYLAMVEEGLGTKNLVANAMRIITGKTYYNALSQDTVAMMVNDLITVGAKPAVILAYWATGSDEWFKDERRLKDMVQGWGKACQMSDAVWGGGETPMLADVNIKTAINMAGACFGTIKPKKRLILGDKLEIGDAIILLESSGIHANGLSLARRIAKQLPKGYATKLSDCSMFGEALLQPTIIYSRLMQDLFDNNIDIHYMSNITGHGWRKIMRHTKALTYRMHSIVPVHPVFQFIMESGPVEEKEAYGNLNMGAGFAIFIPQKDVEKTIKIAKQHKIRAYNAGVVEKGPKQVIIEPKNIVFEGESLQVRA